MHHYGARLAAALLSFLGVACGMPDFPIHPGLDARTSVVSLDGERLGPYRIRRGWESSLGVTADVSSGSTGVAYSAEQRTARLYLEGRENWRCICEVEEHSEGRDLDCVLSRPGRALRLAFHGGVGRVEGARQVRLVERVSWMSAPLGYHLTDGETPAADVDIAKERVLLAAGIDPDEALPVAAILMSLRP
jgi:hypothetical protein